MRCFSAHAHKQVKLVKAKYTWRSIINLLLSMKTQFYMNNRQRELTMITTTLMFYHMIGVVGDLMMRATATSTRRNDQ